MVSNLFPGANSISAVSAGIATILSIFLMFKHAKYYAVPKEQTQIIRILWMIPIYAVDCAVATWEPDWSRYVDPLRDCYEAYVLYSFMALLRAYLDTDKESLDQKFEGKIQHHFFPFCCLKPLPVNRMFFYHMEQGVMQYMVLKPVLAIVQLITTVCKVYDGGIFDYNRGYTYILLFTNISQSIALYCLIYIHHSLHNCPEMRGRYLLGKLLCIKAVVFFAFWQSCLFSLLEYISVIKDTDDMTADVRAAALDDFILCLEMAIVAVSHHWVFSYDEYRTKLEPIASLLKKTGWRGPADDVDTNALPPEYRHMTEEQLEAQAALEKEARNGHTRQAMIDIINVSDVTSDLREHLITPHSKNGVTNNMKRGAIMPEIVGSKNTDLAERTPSSYIRPEEDRTTSDA